MAKQLAELLQEALKICENSGWVVPEREQLRAENQRLKAQISELNDWNQALENGTLAEAKDRREALRKGFLSGFEAGKRRNARVASLEAERAALKARVAKLENENAALLGLVAELEAALKAAKGVHA
jgi:regulator of replication initiation timing